VGVAGRQTIRIVVLAVLSALLMPPGRGDAEVTGFSGSATGISLRVESPDGPVEVQQPNVTLPPAGGGPFTAAQASLSLPEILDTGALEVSTEGQGLGTHDGEVRSSATVANVNSGGEPPEHIADSMRADCVANAAGATGATTIVGGNITGVGPLPTNPAPNTTIPLPDGDDVTLVLNEQIVATTPGFEATITVRAAHARFRGGLEEGDLIVAEATCGVTGPDVLTAATPPVTPAEAAPPVIAAPRFTG
jgi:hypothetical protein